jgi:hypothetical protein
MKTKTLKIIIDVLLLVLLILSLFSSRDGHVIRHIIEGTLLTVLAVLHVFINRKWLTSVGKKIISGKTKGNVRLQYGIDVLLIAVWGFSIITGFLAMGFSVWGIESYFGFIRMHGVSARLGILLIIVHIIQHRKHIVSYFKSFKMKG